MVSSSLLDTDCVQNAFNTLDEDYHRIFIHYLQGKIVNFDPIAFNAYEILAPKNFIGVSDIVEDNVLEQRFNDIHNKNNSIEEALIRLNAEIILNDDNNTSIIQTLYMLDTMWECNKNCSSEEL